MKKASLPTFTREASRVGASLCSVALALCLSHCDEPVEERQVLQAVTASATTPPPTPPPAATPPIVEGAPFPRGPFGLGTPVATAEIEPWDIDVGPDGRGLPPGQGTAAEGKLLYTKECIACHGSTGNNGPMAALVGGQGTLAGPTPVRTVGSYWPYATTLFDYIRRAMPQLKPQSLSATQVYALTAYVLFLNGLVDENEVMNATSLPEVRMPNRDGFVTDDPRPDVHPSGSTD